MKNIALILGIGLLFMACQEDKPAPFFGENTIVFDSDNLKETNQVTKNFYWAAALDPDAEYDTCWIDVAAVGNAVPYDRELKIVQDTAIGWDQVYDNAGNLVDSVSYIIPNQAVAGKHFVELDNEGLKPFMKMPANAFKTVIPVVMRRDSENKKALTLQIRLVDTPTTKIGEKRLTTCQITIE